MPQRLILLFLLLSSSQIVFAQSDFEVVKQRVIADMLKRPIDDKRIAAIMEEMEPNGRWADINYVDLSNTGFEHANHLRRALSMSEAYNTESSDYYHNKEISKLINQTVAVWCLSDYICENWWFNQIFTPHTLASILLLMGDQIDSEVRSKAMPIMNRAIWKPQGPDREVTGSRLEVSLRKLDWL